MASKETAKGTRLSKCKCRAHAALADYSGSRRNNLRKVVVPSWRSKPHRLKSATQMKGSTLCLAKRPLSRTLQTSLIFQTMKRRRIPVRHGNGTKRIRFKCKTSTNKCIPTTLLIICSSTSRATNPIIIIRVPTSGRARSFLDWTKQQTRTQQTSIVRISSHLHLARGNKASTSPPKICNFTWLASVKGDTKISYDERVCSGAL